uniref:NADH dehydrogenase subunit 6 n=1 Tax=Trimusculus reticulatus TaxID=981059 RepID=G8HTF3_9EUPU|nr:NADH dehydrogenase subunit 6 [Trimusculus reticulatus]AEQ93934.1 NADH dehydrogenase subunit 6 [Trimusculus reticulatus]
MDMFFFLLAFFLAGMFPVFSSPISQGALLVLMSFCLVSLISVFSSSWYGYILFLVFIGGLLVLFIYVCMVSSNYSFSAKFSEVVIFALLSLYFLTMVGGSSIARLLGFSTWESGSSLSLLLFVGLVVLLLAAFLGIVRVITGGGALIVSSS